MRNRKEERGGKRKRVKENKKRVEREEWESVCESMKKVYLHLLNLPFPSLSQGRNMLHMLALSSTESGDKEVFLHLFLKKKVPLTSMDRNGKTPLFYAIEVRREDGEREKRDPYFSLLFLFTFLFHFFLLISFHSLFADQ